MELMLASTRRKIEPSFSICFGLRTLAFRSYQLRFQVIAVPGQRLYAATR